MLKKCVDNCFTPSRPLRSPGATRTRPYSHAASFTRSTTLTPTLILPIPSQPPNPSHITTQGTHHLQAADLMENRSDTLHRQLLSHKLLSLITKASEPIRATKLHSLLLHCSIFQIHHSLKDLLDTGMIQRYGDGLYTTIPAPSRRLPPDTPPTSKPTSSPNPTTPIKSTTQPATSLSSAFTTKTNPQPANSLNHTLPKNLTSQPATSLNSSPAITPTSQPANSLASNAAINSIPEPAKPPNSSEATNTGSTSTTTQSLRWLNS